MALPSSWSPFVCGHMTRIPSLECRTAPLASFPSLHHSTAWLPAWRSPPSLPRFLPIFVTKWNTNGHPYFQRDLVLEVHAIQIWTSTSSNPLEALLRQERGASSAATVVSTSAAFSQVLCSRLVLSVSGRRHTHQGTRNTNSPCVHQHRMFRRGRRGALPSLSLPSLLLSCSLSVAKCECAIVCATLCPVSRSV